MARFEVDEEAQHLVVDPKRLRVGTVDLVDRDDRLQPEGQGLPGDEAGLGHRPLGGVHQDEHAIDHPKDPLHLAAEVGVAGGVHDVDLHVLVMNGRILGHDGDALLALEVDGIHDTLDHVLVGPEDA